MAILSLATLAGFDDDHCTAVRPSRIGCLFVSVPAGVELPHDTVASYISPVVSWIPDSGLRSDRPSWGMGSSPG